MEIVNVLYAGPTAVSMGYFEPGPQQQQREKSDSVSLDVWCDHNARQPLDNRSSARQARGERANLKQNVIL